MTNQVLKARYTTTHRLVVIMNGDWMMRTDVVRRYQVDVPDYASCRASYNAKTGTTEITFSWTQVDECPDYMLQP